MMRISRRRITYALLAGATLMLGGCFGSFPVTRSIYRANSNVYGSVPGDSTQRKMAQSAVMWLFLPVYGVVGIADFAVFNVIEFWTGNPVHMGMRQESNGTAVALEPDPDGRQATLTISRDGKVISSERLVKVTNSLVEIRDTEGNLKGMMVRQTSGDVQFTDPNGRVTQTVAAR